jgi:hypothetical protein
VRGLRVGGAGGRLHQTCNRGEKVITFSSVADPHHFDANPDPDPTFHFDTDPDPSFQINAQNLEKLWLVICNLMRIRIRIELSL